MSKRKFVLTLLAAAAPVLWAQSTTTSSTYTATQNLPPIGLAATETAQVNAVNVAEASSSGTAASCTGSISFLNSGGTVIGTATTYTLGTNQLKSVSLPYSSVGATGRTEIRAVITQTVTTGSDVPCDLLISLETFDTTSGVTHVYVSRGSGGYGPPGGGGPSH
jgi:hypothetical protein